MRKAMVVTLAVTLSLPFQSVIAYADTATSTSTSTSTSTMSPTTTTTTSTSPTPTTGSDQTTIPPVLDANGQPVSPGTLPDSPVYWLSNLIQKIQVLLTFDSVKKATLDENQALQKLAAARDMLQKGKGELAQKTLDEYSQKVQDAQKILEQLKDPNSNSAQLLETALAQTDTKNIQVLNNLLDKLPPQAAEKLAVNIVQSMQKTVDKMTAEQKNEVKAQIKETAKHMKEDNLDTQATAALAQFQTSLGIKNEENAKAQITSMSDEDTPKGSESQSEQEKQQKQQTEQKVERKKGQQIGQQKEHEEEHESDQEQENKDQKQDNLGTPTQIVVPAPSPAPAPSPTPSPTPTPTPSSVTQPGVTPSTSGQAQSSVPSLQAPRHENPSEPGHDSRDKEKTKERDDD